MADGYLELGFVLHLVLAFSFQRWLEKNPEQEMLMFCYRETVLLISWLETSLLEAACRLMER